MKEVVIVGPGGLGGTFAALLAHKGQCSVTVVGRPGPHIDAINTAGLKLTGLTECVPRIKAISDPSKITACDVLIFVVKAQDTQTVLAGTAHIEVRDFAASLQNGTIKDDDLIKTFGRDKVIGAMAIVAGERPAPGQIKWTYDGITHFGELDGSVSPRVEQIVALCHNAGLVTEATDAILSSTWSKMVGWIPIGLYATLARKTNAGVLSDPLMAAGYVGMVRELSALATARSIPLIDLGPYHIASWNQGSATEASERVMASPLAASPSTHSAYQDIQKGQPTEFSACVAPMLAEAQSRGVELPSVRALYAALMGLEQTLCQVAW